MKKLILVDVPSIEILNVEEMKILIGGNTTTTTPFAVYECECKNLPSKPKTETVNADSEASAVAGAKRDKCKESQNVTCKYKCDIDGVVRK